MKTTIETNDKQIVEAFLLTILIARVDVEERKTLTAAFLKAIGYNNADEIVAEGNFDVTYNPKAKQNGYICIIFPFMPGC